MKLTAVQLKVSQVKTKPKTVNCLKPCHLSRPGVMVIGWEAVPEPYADCIRLA
jgi:hypothetical protein